MAGNLSWRWSSGRPLNLTSLVSQQDLQLRSGLLWFRLDSIPTPHQECKLRVDGRKRGEQRLGEMVA
jgi:hypothetical protein